MEFIKVKNNKNKKVLEGENQGNIILLLPSECDNGLDGMAYPVETYDLIKFAELTKTEFKVAIPEESNAMDMLLLHSDEFWLPVFKLIGTITLSVVANFVTDFIKFKCGDYFNIKSKTVHFKVVISDKKNGYEKEISYDGPTDKLTEMFSKIDINTIMEDK